MTRRGGQALRPGVGDAEGVAVRRMLLLLGEDAARYDTLLREWLWEREASASRRTGVRPPSGFRSWTEARLRHPLSLPPMALFRDAREVGPEGARRALGCWREAVDRAERDAMGEGGDPPDSAAGAWLALVRRDPGQAFVSFARLADCTSPWGALVGRDGAAAARAMEDRDTVSWTRWHAFVRSSPHLRVCVLAAAALEGVTSDRVLWAARRVLSGSGQSTPSWRAVADGLCSPLADMPTFGANEEEQRLGAIREFAAQPNRSPADWTGLFDGRAGAAAEMSAWLRAVETGRRRPPLDGLLDYGIWLIERGMGRSGAGGVRVMSSQRRPCSTSAGDNPARRIVSS